MHIHIATEVGLNGVKHNHLGIGFLDSLLQSFIGEGQPPATDDGATPAEPIEQQPQEPAKPAQTAEENAKFAEIRRAAEAKAKQEAAAIAQQQIDSWYASQYAGQVNPYNGKPIDSEAAFKEYEQQHQIAEMAVKTGLSYQEQQDFIRKAVVGSPEYQQAVQMAEQAAAENYQLKLSRVQDLMAKDLESVKKYNPKESAKTVDDLGETFIKLRCSGLDPVTAYEVAVKEKQRLNPAPPSMGDVKGGNAAEPEFYTFEQVKNMTQAEVSKNYEKIRKSQARW